MEISIWGNELIAWTAAVAFSEYGNIVHVNQNKKLNASLEEQVQPSSFLHNEPGLLNKVNDQYATGRLIFGDTSSALACPIQIIALNPNFFEIAKELVLEISKNLTEDILIINYSTFGLGATDELQKILNIYKKHSIAYIPDSLSEGNAFEVFTKPETLVIGSQDKQSNRLIKALYKPFIKHINQILIVEAREAEFMKFAINGMLALRLGYINELANLSDQLGINIDTIITGMGSDNRIGKDYLSPGCGFGGSYFSQTIQGMAYLLKSNRNSIILNTLLDENEKQKLLPFRKLWQHFNTNITGKKIAIWGLSFKPNTASIENSPSLSIIKTLLAQGCIVSAHDPQAMPNFRKIFPESQSISYHENAMDTLYNCEALLTLTEWHEYWSPDYHKMLTRMKVPVIIDGRNIFDPILIKELGFTYYGVGRQ